MSLDFDFGNIGSKNILEKIKPSNHKIFIETGTYLGNGTQWALDNFKEVITIEILDEYYKKAIERFKDESRLTLVKGSSADRMEEILNDIDEACFIFLDAHGDINVQGPNPLYKEISAIKNHKVKNHIVAIDDVRRIGDPSDPCWSKVSLDTLKESLKEVNNEYEIFVFKDTLIAALKEDLDLQWWEN